MRARRRGLGSTGCLEIALDVGDGGTEQHVTEGLGAGDVRLEGLAVHADVPAMALGAFVVLSASHAPGQLEGTTPHHHTRGNPHTQSHTQSPSCLNYHTQTQRTLASFVSYWMWEIFKRC